MVQKKEWCSFYFDANMIWKKVDSKEDWLEVIDAYDGNLEFLKRACNAYCNHPDMVPKFGFRAECCGSLTLEKWAQAHNMELFS